jgi:hypothetical protein
MFPAMWCALWSVVWLSAKAKDWDDLQNARRRKSRQWRPILTGRTTRTNVAG